MAKCKLAGLVAAQPRPDLLTGRGASDVISVWAEPIRDSFGLRRPTCYALRSPNVASRLVTMRSLLLAASLLLLPAPASALCRCTCIRGEMKPICQQTDLMVPI